LVSLLTVIKPRPGLERDGVTDLDVAHPGVADELVAGGSL